MTVKYAITADVQWSDGVPVTADDLLLSWIASSGKFNTAKLKTDDNGIRLAQSAVVAFDTASLGLALVTDLPAISGDDGQPRPSTTRSPSSTTTSISASAPAATSWPRRR